MSLRALTNLITSLTDDELSNLVSQKYCSLIKRVASDPERYCNYEKKMEDLQKSLCEKMKITEESSISILHLSGRPMKCLGRHGIYTIGDLCQTSIRELMDFRNLGRKSFDEIEGKLRDFGFTLKEE